MNTELIIDLQGLSDVLEDIDERHGVTLADVYLVRQAADELERLYAVVGKLPKYADTGQLFLPGLDLAWVVFRGEVMPAVHRGERRYGERFCRNAYVLACGDGITCYSTEAAAQAATQRGDEVKP
jgi:hypothetical protein